MLISTHDRFGSKSVALPCVVPSQRHKIWIEVGKLVHRRWIQFQQFIIHFRQTADEPQQLASFSRQTTARPI